VYECVAALAADPASAVVIFSGSDKARARAVSICHCEGRAACGVSRVCILLQCLPAGPVSAGIATGRGQAAAPRIPAAVPVMLRRAEQGARRACVAARDPGPTRGSSAQGRLEEAFGALPVWLAAENGVFIRPPGDAWVTLLQARRAAPAHAPHGPKRCSEPASTAAPGQRPAPVRSMRS